MNIEYYMGKIDEKPLDTIVQNGGMCGIFRTIACIGDSLSSGEFESIMNGEHGYHDMYEYSWGQFLARDAGVTVYNFSKGGMTAKKYMDSFAEERGFWSPELRANAYIIALGANDWGAILRGEIEFGDISDIDLQDYKKNKPTFVGSYAAIIQRYKELSPLSKFFLMTYPKGNGSKAETAAERAEILDRIADTIRKLAELFDRTYVIDFRRYAPEANDEFKKYFFLANHLTPAGYRFSALMVESYIDYIVRHNPEDFKQLGFMWTEYYNETVPR